MTASSGQMLRVLIVEDEPRYRALLDREIAAMGYGCTACPTAEEALECLERDHFDAALLDLHLPGMGGMEFFERVREGRPDLAVIVLTGFGDMATAIQALRWHAVDFLTKPCGLDEIERALSKVLSRKRDLESPEPLPETAPPEIPASPSSASDAPRSLADLEREHILATLARHHGHKPAAAAELGVSLRTLYNKLAAYQQQGHLPAADDEQR